MATQTPTMLITIVPTTTRPLDANAPTSRQSGSRYANGTAPCGGCGAVLLDRRGVRRALCCYCSRTGGQ